MTIYLQAICQTGPPMFVNWSHIMQHDPDAHNCGFGRPTHLARYVHYIKLTCEVAIHTNFFLDIFQWFQNHRLKVACKD